MPVRREQFDYLFEEMSEIDDLVRLNNPAFVNGFHVINLQAGRMGHTIDRLRWIQTNLKDAEAILLKNIAGLRSANPNQKPKGTNYARRVLRDKPLWKKVVSAHALSDAHKENVDPSLSSASHGDDKDESELSKALKNMSARDAKIEFERHDYVLRHKLEGIKRLNNLMDHYLAVLRPRQKTLDYLERVGEKWARRVFEPYDVEKISGAELEVAEGSYEVKTITGVLDILPGDFTQLCEVEDIGRASKRKDDWTAEMEMEMEMETPETMRSKRICTLESKDTRRNTRSKKTRNTYEARL